MNKDRKEAEGKREIKNTMIKKGASTLTGGVTASTFPGAPGAGAGVAAAAGLSSSDEAKASKSGFAMRKVPFKPSALA